MKAATSGRGIVEWDAVISIHAAREGGDFARKVYDYRMRFQSTPPVKAATANPQLKGEWESFQSTPPVKAATSTEVM